MKISITEKNVVKTFENCLGKIKNSGFQRGDYQIAKPNENYDLLFEIKNRNEIKTIVIEIKNSGEPRFARQAVNGLSRFVSERSNSYGVFAAPYISSRAAEICNGAGMGYIDLAGNCHLDFGSTYIHIEGKPNLYSEKRSLRSLYSPRSERILRVLLANGPREWKIEEMANEADVSIGLVAKVKNLLLEQEWIDSKSVGFQLIKPLELLRDWEKNYEFKQNKVSQFYSMSEIPEIEEKLSRAGKKLGIAVGFTGFSGAAQISPIVRYTRVMAYIRSDIDVVANELGLKKVTSGANVTLITPYDEGVFYQTKMKNNLPVISPIQLYLDLIEIEGRGEEAAQEILEGVIQKIW